MFFLKLKADRIVSWIGEIGDALDHAHHKKDGGIDPDRDAGIALFNLDERRPANRGALRRRYHGNPTAPPGVPYVMAQFAQGMPYRDW
jgi:hypothetical protein